MESVKCFSHCIPIFYHCLSFFFQGGHQALKNKLVKKQTIFIQHSSKSRIANATASVATGVSGIDIRFVPFSTSDNIRFLHYSLI